METIFLAGLWGPALLAFGLGALISRDHYEKLYRHIGQEHLGMLIVGLAGIIIGIAHVMAHNVWVTPVEMIISLLGWLLLLKGAVMTIVPRIAIDKSNWFAGNSSLLTGAGLITLVAGAYLSWVAYFM